jgi:hypothetical protein
MRKSQVAGEIMIKLIKISELSILLYLGTVVDKGQVAGETMIEPNEISVASTLLPSSPRQQKGFTYRRYSNELLPRITHKQDFFLHLISIQITQQHHRTFRHPSHTMPPRTIVHSDENHSYHAVAAFSSRGLQIGDEGKILRHSDDGQVQISIV